MYSILAKKLFSKGVRLTPKHNSLFSVTDAVDVNGYEQQLYNKAILGVSNVVKSKITTYKNVILPISNDIEECVKELANVSTDSYEDKITITPLTHTNYSQLFSNVEGVHLEATASVSELPKNPLVIEYDKKNVDDAINTLPGYTREQVNVIEHSLSDSRRKKLHESIFDNVSSNNSFLSDLNLDLVSNQDDICYILAIALGYYNGDSYVANMAKDKTKFSYLAKLINVLVTMIVNIEKQYAYNLETEVLVAGVNISGGMLDIRVIGEVYNTYLESNSVDALVGYGYSYLNSDSDSTLQNRITLSNFINDIDIYLKSYVNLNRTAAIKRELEHVQVLKVAYRSAVTKLVNTLSDEVLSMAGLETPADLSELNRSVSSFVDSIGAEELAEVTEQCRRITGELIFKRDDFMEFMANMRYYAGVFPDESPEYVATAVAVSMTIDILMEQLEVTRV